MSDTAQLWHRQIVRFRPDLDSQQREVLADILQRAWIACGYPFWDCVRKYT